MIFDVYITWNHKFNLKNKMVTTYTESKSINKLQTVRIGILIFQ